MENANDSSGNSRNLTASSVSFARAKFRFGALMSRSIESYLRSYDSFDIDKYADNWTLMGWFLASSLTTGDLTEIVYFSGAGETYVRVTLKSLSSVWNLQIASAVSQTTNYPVGAAINTWYHVAVAYAGSTHTLYIYFNGALLGTIAQSIRSYGDTRLTFGHDVDHCINGLLDEFAVYSKTLTAQEIRRYYAWATGRL